MFLILVSGSISLLSLATASLTEDCIGFLRTCYYIARSWPGLRLGFGQSILLTRRNSLPGSASATVSWWAIMFPCLVCCTSRTFWTLAIAFLHSGGKTRRLSQILVADVGPLAVTLGGLIINGKPNVFCTSVFNGEYYAGPRDPFEFGPRAEAARLEGKH